jgi:phosphoribosyl-ATP pyrophosphohydrolase
MAALVRHDTAVEAAFRHADTETRADAAQIARLYDALDCVNERENPRTARLLACGRSKIAQKLIEEAGEIALEAVRHRSRHVVRESADLIYHLVVLWHECGIAPEEIWAEMERRADKLGIAEKLPKAPDRHTAAIGFGK